MNHLSVAIADDNQKILDLLEKVIGTDQELDLVGKAKNGEEMCRIIKEKNPDVVLLRPDYAENGRTDCHGSDQSG